MSSSIIHNKKTIVYEPVPFNRSILHQNDTYSKVHIPVSASTAKELMDDYKCTTAQCRYIVDQILDDKDFTLLKKGYWLIWRQTSGPKGNCIRLKFCQKLTNNTTLWHRIQDDAIVQTLQQLLPDIKDSLLTLDDIAYKCNYLETVIMIETNRYKEIGLNISYTGYDDHAEVVATIALTSRSSDHLIQKFEETPMTTLSNERALFKNRDPQLFDNIVIYGGKIDYNTQIYTGPSAVDFHSLMACKPILAPCGTEMFDEQFTSSSSSSDSD